MERCTGRFFSRMKMNMPKARPRTQKRSPIISRRWPSTPRNDTEDKSGSFSAASPPASLAGSAVCASAWPAVRSYGAIRAADSFTRRDPTDARYTFQVRIKILQNILFRDRGVCLRRSVDRPQQVDLSRVQSPPEFRTRSEHASTARQIKIRSADLAASENLCRKYMAPSPATRSAQSTRL